MIRAWPRWRREWTRLRELRHPGPIKSFATPDRCTPDPPSSEKGDRKLRAPRGGTRGWPTSTESRGSGPSGLGPRLLIAGAERGGVGRVVRPGGRRHFGQPGGAVEEPSGAQAAAEAGGGASCLKAVSWDVPGELGLQRLGRPFFVLVPVAVEGPWREVGAAVRCHRSASGPR
ncbi:hypothetical protein NDU88_003410 [Pleurodeles waltl]|uniref:Uncharacterized protein n=1 Tax=Pleurodeles waltl TaxID=8319 RepID=A0AAV7WRK6_PLEWA|nr:hypothetical protein NDU88_003410 [Pleurodeles waltl]